ncbi:MAG: hypothetical protein A4E27_00645 [Methanobacterium sp. PtaU1.Bin242]|jgi:hypothetical protein|nr:MAG: hypothetical protein A4E27_00645 [Methanobacterium sp. PtaU1.Bin242]
MKIPEKITIGGVTYNITFSENIGGNENQTGDIDFHNAQIWISKDTDKDVQKLTFYHEVVHGIFMALGYGNDDKITIDERFVDSFSHYLIQFVEQLEG